MAPGLTSQVSRTRKKRAPLLEALCVKMSMEISEFLKTSEEPWPDSNYGDGYRCSAYLKDGLFLPCVMIRKNKTYIRERENGVSSLIVAYCQIRTRLWLCPDHYE